MAVITTTSTHSISVRLMSEEMGRTDSQIVIVRCGKRTVKRRRRGRESGREESPITIWTSCYLVNGPSIDVAP